MGLVQPKKHLRQALQLSLTPCNDLGLDPQGANEHSFVLAVSVCSFTTNLTKQLLFCHRV